MRAKVCNKYANCGPVRREYATPLWCRPMIKFLAWQEESGLWPKIVVVSVCWQQQVASRHSGSKVIEFLSDYKLRIRHAWLQLMTGSYTAHCTQQQVPLATSKITVAGACTKFCMSHVCVQLPRPPNTGWTKRRNDDDASKFPLWAQPRVQRTCMFVDMLRTWHNNKMLPATAALPSHASPHSPRCTIVRHQQWQLSWLDTSEPG